MDSDTLFGDLAFVPPLDWYAGKDLVLWGDADEVAKGNSMTGWRPRHTHLLRIHDSCSCMYFCPMTSFLMKGAQRWGALVWHCCDESSKRASFCRTSLLCTHFFPPVAAAAAGLNTGVMLVRNSQWSRDFFAALQEYGVRDTMAYEEVRAPTHTSPTSG